MLLKDFIFWTNFSSRLLVDLQNWCVICRDSWAWNWLWDASVWLAENLFERQRWQASTWIMCKIGKLFVLISTKDNLLHVSFYNKTWPFDSNMGKFLQGISGFNWVSIYFSQISRTLLIWLWFNFNTIFCSFCKIIWVLFAEYTGRLSSFSCPCYSFCVQWWWYSSSL